jgi:hypothetical protein
MQAAVLDSATSRLKEIRNEFRLLVGKGGGIVTAGE